MNTPSRRLLLACSLLTLSAAPLWAVAQAPTTPAPPAAPFAAPPAPPPTVTLSNDDASYLIGVNFGQSIHQFGITDQLSVDTIVRGLKEGLAGKKLEASDQRNLQGYFRGQIDAITQHNVQAGKEFLEKNGHEKGVVTTASGLEYRILVAGDKKGASPTATDQVTVQYRGTLLDGTEFDSSYSRNQPATFPVNGVIKGWTEALQLMKPGAKWMLWIPADLAYGDKPRPGIPGGSTLTFEVELQSVKAAPPPPPPAPPAKNGPLGGTAFPAPPPQGGAAPPPAPPAPPAAK